MLTMLVTDRHLQVVAPPITEYGAIDAVLRHNAVGSGAATLPAHPWIVDAMQPGRRIVLVRDGAVWCAGPLEAPADYRWSVEGDPAGALTVRWATDELLVSGYVTYPNPSLAPDSTGQPAYRQYPRQAAVTTMRDLVATQCGPGARAERRIPALELGPPPAAPGPARPPWRTRFAPLGDALRELAEPDGLTWRVRQDGDRLLFEVEPRRDLTRTARFSRGLGNLRSLAYARWAPTATHVIAGGGGEGADRVIRVAGDAAAAAEWWRSEAFRDRRDVADDGDGELSAAAAEALADAAASVQLSTVTVDAPGMRAGLDYRLGDVVAVALPGGLEAAETVRALHLAATPRAGERVTATIGAHARTTDDPLGRLVAELARRLARHERR